MKEHPKDNSISDGQPDGQRILLKVELIVIENSGLGSGLLP
jgi:hypothetical protein